MSLEHLRDPLPDNIWKRNVLLMSLLRRKTLDLWSTQMNKDSVWEAQAVLKDGLRPPGHDQHVGPSHTTLTT